MGKLSDSNSKRFGSGRIICLYIGSFATLIGFVIGASAFSIRGLWLSMIPGALFQQNFNVFKAMLADYHEEISHFEQLEKETYNTNDTCGVSPLGCNKSDSISRNTSSERAGSVGKLGMSVGIAFMAGPLLGATLVKSYECAVILAIVLVCLSTLWISKMPKLQLQSNAIQMREKKEAKKSKPSIFVQLSSMIDVKSARSSPAILLIIIRICMALAFHIFNTIWTISLKKRFNFGPRDHGQFMSFVGLMYALSQGYFSKRILTPLGHKGRIRVILLCCVTLGVGRFVAYQVDDLALVYVMFAFIVTALGVVNTILTADTCLIAPSTEIGGLFGVLEAAQSGAGMIGPLAGGALAKIHPINAPLSAVVGLYVFVFILVFVGYEKFIFSKSFTKLEKKQV